MTTLVQIDGEFFDAHDDIPALRAALRDANTRLATALRAYAPMCRHCSRTATVDGVEGEGPTAITRRACDIEAHRVGLTDVREMPFAAEIRALNQGGDHGNR